MAPENLEARGALRRSGRVFAFTLAGGFLFVGAIAYWRESAVAQRVALALALLALVAGIVVPGRLEPVRRGWMKFGEAIGRVTTPVLLAIVYYGVLTPTALVRRMLAGRGSERPTTWEQRAPASPKARMERQF